MPQHEHGPPLGRQQAEDVHRAVCVLEDDPFGGGAQAAEDVAAGAGEEPGAEVEALGAVVVAGDHDHGDPEAHGELGQGLVQQADGVRGRDGAVVDVAGDDDMLPHDRLVPVVRPCAALADHQRR